MCTCHWRTPSGAHRCANANIAHHSDGPRSVGAGPYQLGARTIHELVFKTLGVCKTVNWPSHSWGPLNTTGAQKAFNGTSANSGSTKLSGAHDSLGGPMLSWGPAKVTVIMGDSRSPLDVRWAHAQSGRHSTGDLSNSGLKNISINEEDSHELVWGLLLLGACKIQE